MKIRNEYERVSSLEIWNLIVAYINKNKQFMSTTGVKYKALVSGESINYTGGRLEGEKTAQGEFISKQLFIATYNKVRMLDCINMKNVKPYINRKESSFVGLLKSAGIIE